MIGITSQTGLLIFFWFICRIVVYNGIIILRLADNMKKYRNLKNGEKAEELDLPINLIIKTNCPKKWIIEDLETGQRYKANGNTEIGKMFDLIDDKK